MLVRVKVNIGRKVTVPSDTDLLNYQLISYHELVRATSNFTDDNLLGAGSFGKVFKGELDDGSVVAIKVLNMEHELASKSFDTECRALRMARHRNLVKIISTCSNLDFRALILEYMPHGSLDDWLYSNDGRQHSFLQRVAIMLDVAMAMEYLHHQHFEAVLHCDLKPSNILLDQDMIAHVSDFGISKLLAGDENSITLTSMPGTVGYMAPGKFKFSLQCMMQHTSLFLFKLTSFLLTWNEQSSDQQEKHHVPVTFIAMELFSLKSSQGKSRLMQCLLVS